VRRRTSLHDAALYLRGQINTRLSRVFNAWDRTPRPVPPPLAEVIAGERSRCTWLWAEGGKALDCVLWPIARSAADLLTEGPLGAIRRCEGKGCGWLFLDTSRNRTRRWCDMRICGNRAKARRHHERMKAGAA